MNKQKGQNNCSYDFMIYLHKSYEDKLGFKSVTPGAVVRCTTDCAMVWAQSFKANNVIT